MNDNIYIDFCVTRAPWFRNCPNLWNEHTLDRSALRAYANALKRHPRFDLAKRRFAENMLAAFKTHQPLARLLRGEHDLAFLAFVLSLHHQRDESDPLSGASYSRVIELFGLLNMGSPTLVKALLGLARIRGYLRVQSVAGSRTKLLAPTDSLLETLAVWFTANLAAVELIHPFPEPASHLGKQPGMLYRVFAYGVSAYVHNGFFLSEDFPMVRAFMGRSNGYLVLMALIASAETDGQGNLLAAAPTQELAQGLSVSRGTVRNILKQAQNAGWLNEISRGSYQVRLSQEFAQICDDWMAMELAWMSGVAAEAWLKLAADTD